MSTWGFASIVSTLKEKSNEAFATISSDLQEFSSTVRSDVSEVAKDVRQKVEAKTNEPEEKDNDVISSSIYSFGSTMGSLGSQLLQGAEGLLTGEIKKDESVNPSESLVSDETQPSGQQFRLITLQESDATYTDTPSNIDEFEKWKSEVNQEQLKDIKNEIIVYYPIVLRKFEELVPKLINEDSFWENYIYKASRFSAEESRRAELLEMAEGSDEEVGWSDDEDEDKINPDSVSSKDESMNSENHSEKVFSVKSETKDPEEDGDELLSQTLQESSVLDTSVKSPGNDNIDTKNSVEISAPISAPSSSDGSWIDVDQTDTKVQEFNLPSSEAAIEEENDWGSDDELISPKETKAPKGIVSSAAINSVDDDDELGDWGDDE